jgi:2-polyprenyl-3-methyl-5-hydroxy-6-metoxy-1,4-benzoquinol methylase
VENRKDLFINENYLSPIDGYPERPVFWFKEAMLPDVKEEFTGRKQFLDVGCAFGYYTALFCSFVDQVTGIDFADNRIEQAKTNFTNVNLHFYCSPIEDFQSDQKFDCMFTSMVLQHIKVADKIKVFSNLSTLATDDCKFVMYDFNSLIEEISDAWVSPVSPAWLAKYAPDWKVESCEPFCNEYQTENSTIWKYILSKVVK